MVEAVSTPPAQGIISTQAEQIRNDKPAVDKQPRPEPEPPPPPPPAETGRGGNVDTSA